MRAYDFCIQKIYRFQPESNPQPRGLRRGYATSKPPKQTKIFILHLNSNSVAQQPMRTTAYCAHFTVSDHWTLKDMSRCSDQVVSLKRNTQCFKSPRKLGTHLSTHCRRDERLSRPCPAR
ncbi:hypothetical protein TNCV_2198851 [Trichonephila clavipes]|nr:hypothetical protein TNCV_2198851 [Trichonephila clavipes]